MNEPDLRAASAGAARVVNQRQARIGQARQQAVDVLDLEAGVMQAGAAVLDVAADGALVLAGAARRPVVDDAQGARVYVLQELQLQVADGDEGAAQPPMNSGWWLR